MIRNKTLNFALLLLLLLPLEALSDDKSTFAVAKFNLQDSAKKPVDPALSTDLVYRVAFGQVAEVKLLLANGADPEAKNTAGLPVLAIATIRKDDEAPKIVTALIKAGANVNKISSNGDMAVLEAVKNGRADVLQILIDHRAVLGQVRSRDGYDLQTLAETRGNLEIVNILNAGLENEKDKIQDLKSEDNFIRLVQQYAFLSCANEYLNFYISTEPRGVNMVAFDKVVTDNSGEIADTAGKIKMIFRMNDSDLKNMQLSARDQIVAQMKIYETNENRALNGVGTDDDLNNRCWKIAKKWNDSKINREQYRLNTQ